MNTISDIARSIQKSGLKVTPQRVAIMQALMKLDHPRAEDIFKEVSAGMPGISPATVYNSLEALVTRKIISKVHTNAGTMRYDAICEQHHHLYCTSSDRMEDYFDEELDRVLKEYFKRKKIPSFKIREIKLQIMGEFESEATGTDIRGKTTSSVK
jgi:Fur family transcriptional regulator, peroxide stress response regulator